MNISQHTDFRRSNLFNRYDGPRLSKQYASNLLSLSNKSADSLRLASNASEHQTNKQRNFKSTAIRITDTSPNNKTTSVEMKAQNAAIQRKIKRHLQSQQLSSSHKANIINMVFKLHHRYKNSMLNDQSQQTFHVVRRTKTQTSHPATQRNECNLVVEIPKSPLKPSSHAEKRLMNYLKKKSNNSQSGKNFPIYSPIQIVKPFEGKPNQRNQRVFTQPEPNPQNISKTTFTNTNQYLLKRRFHNKKDYFVFSMENRAVSQNKTQLYRDFLWKINFSNGLLVEPTSDSSHQYRIFIGNGNNCLLIKGLMKKRFWWTITDKITEDVNFVWTQLKIMDYFSFQQPYRCAKSRDKSAPKSREKSKSNLESYSREIEQIKKVRQKMEGTKIDRLEAHAMILSEEDLKQWKSHYQRHKQLEQKLDAKIHYRRAGLLKRKKATKISSPQKLKIQNHFTCNYFIGNKKAMFYCMRQLYQLTNRNIFQSLPLTFHISKGTEDPEYKKFMNYYNFFAEEKRTGKCHNIWIVKPGQYTNRGKGITVCQSIDDIIVRLKGKQRNANGKYRTFIVQKYIQRPFLYFKRKFDIRHYMMITCINGSFKGYWYSEGYIRTTSFQYSTKNCKNNLIHLTNDAIQKYSEDYGKYEKGNKISYHQFQKYLDTYHKSKRLRFHQSILPSMREIACDAIKSCYMLLDPRRLTHNFELFGLDFMIDQDFHPWLIEINTNPCLELASPLLTRLIPAMLDNCFKITIDPLFQPPSQWPSNKKYNLGQNPLETNKFSLIFDQQTDGGQLENLFTNVERIDKNMGDIEQEEDLYQDEGKQWNEELVL